MFFLFDGIESIDDLDIFLSVRIVFFSSLGEDVTTDITRHDDDTILTIDGTTFAIGDAAIIEHL